jgi:hypothetical protein
MDTLLAEIIKLAFAILTPLLLAAATAIAYRIFRYFGVQLQAADEERVRAVIQDLVLHTEEWAADKAKHSNIPVAAATKAAHFAELALTQLPGVSAGEAKQLAQAELQRIGLGAAGVIHSVNLAIRE